MKSDRKLISRSDTPPRVRAYDLSLELRLWRLQPLLCDRKQRRDEERKEGREGGRERGRERKKGRGFHYDVWKREVEARSIRRGKEACKGTGSQFISVK